MAGKRELNRWGRRRRTGPPAEHCKPEGSIERKHPSRVQVLILSPRAAEQKQDSGRQLYKAPGEGSLARCGDVRWCYLNGSIAPA